ncbi:MAG: VOC family protein [Hydrogenophaga sp.]|jgi:catechol 2,3-dioxygenase-like lactoylglutathione lyase family enzyme|uniref:VOC family protein n=1 Tax=Hydrogenophaga sp. TaxID=1904254 RepID=UPI0027214A9E|nr:VOC family protein [Hydrogenophaga sp.]MDO9482693.1 VOC family protein [Hydrogenophaga sp.]MDP1894576.1 VOC family protein [Hydrogenophaga sp.]MDP2093395.1 VOC family protein [Hydrogenophaga sp.]MDP3345856.1 VOC family protein [Hydrogenophaga sp.]MDP3374699.1 VOC family protein [Hydrogenophaga sp.]
MNIIGLDALVFGVEDLAASRQYLIDYGLRDAGNDRYEALDGTAVIVRAKDDPSLPPGMGTASMLRETVYGVADEATLQAIATELSHDRTVTHEGGVVRSHDDMGFVVAFQVTVRRPLQLPTEVVNAPGAPFQRPANAIGVDQNAPAVPRTLSHVVYFVPDAAKAEAFYVDRLGFVCTDRFTDVGPFLRPAGTLDHHTLFFIQTPPFMKGCEHFTFHMGGPTELMLAGSRFVEKGYQSFWGPGRHKFGSNWFWYFNSPLGCHVEYDADMDLHDNNWKEREAPVGADSSQAFLFQYREKWAPSGGPPPEAGAVPVAAAH